MNGWRMEPAGLQQAVGSASEGVNSVASAIVGSDGGLSTTLGEECVEVLARSTGFDGIVMEAVSGLLTDQLTNRVSTALGQYTTALESTVQAAEAIRAGDQLQASDIAASMTSSDAGSLL